GVAVFLLSLDFPSLFTLLASPSTLNYQLSSRPVFCPDLRLFYATLAAATDPSVEFGMKLKFYGARGSIPVCDAGFQQFGGNTTCFQITFTDTNRIVIIDAGTGLRNLGRDLRAIGHQQDTLPIAFTHFHWDHIQGFPFFSPAYDPEQK